ncbi:SiaB family protein kinase [Cohnella yongneupensis]|uniref:SiaB family protein kinase n=1 Tax=Cohnella yongneupensis TaxID=425006 RepID=A0ABW0QXR8_9BACL
MNDNHLLEVQALLRKNGILITFSGRLSQQLIEEYGEAVKTYLENEDQSKKEIIHTFSIFIEQTQNIKNYYANRNDSPARDRIAQSSVVTIGMNDAGNFICSGNLVENADLPALTARIDAILQLNKDELKKLYKDQLRQGLSDNPAEAGAGVGLIDMARKATLPLEYTVTPQSEGLSFFTLKAVV